MLPFVTCDVFTETPFGGNPLAIVEGADGLTGAQMLTLAREFNLSETIFVQKADDPAHTAKVRIFFPTAEIPFAGHPTIGCAIHLSLKSAPEGDFETLITLEEQAGLVPVTVSRTAGRISAELRAPVIPHGVDRLLPDADLLAAATGIDAAAVGFGSHRPGLWQGGPAFLYLPVRDLATLAAARPHEPAWSQAMDSAGVDSIYLYTHGEGCDFRARMFSPTAGIPEDPATGSASAILAAQLRAAGVLTGHDRFTLHQGVEMGRPSEITLTVQSSAGTLDAVFVRGSAVPVSEGRVRTPS